MSGEDVKSIRNDQGYSACTPAELDALQGSPSSLEGTHCREQSSPTANHAHRAGKVIEQDCCGIGHRSFLSFPCRST
jgi:hypothetical protein